MPTHPICFFHALIFLSCSISNESRLASDDFRRGSKLNQEIDESWGERMVNRSPKWRREVIAISPREERETEDIEDIEKEVYNDYYNDFDLPLASSGGEELLLPVEDGNKTNSSGLLNGIQNFFRHSFHLDDPNATTPKDDHNKSKNEADERNVARHATFDFNIEAVPIFVNGHGKNVPEP